MVPGRGVFVFCSFVAVLNELLLCFPVCFGFCSFYGFLVACVPALCHFAGRVCVVVISLWSETHICLRLVISCFTLVVFWSLCSVLSSASSLSGQCDCVHLSSRPCFHLFLMPSSPFFKLSVCLFCLFFVVSSSFDFNLLCGVRPSVRQSACYLV